VFKLHSVFAVTVLISSALEIFRNSIFKILHIFMYVNSFLISDLAKSMFDDVH
jgi:hypothetical protein